MDNLGSISEQLNVFDDTLKKRGVLDGPRMRSSIFGTKNEFHEIRNETSCKILESEYTFDSMKCSELDSQFGRKTWYLNTDKQNPRFLYVKGKK